MEEEPTQPGIEPRTYSFVAENQEEETDDPSFAATQIEMDPRRLGYHNSGLTDEDLTDVFCIMHPTSMPACMATAHIAEESPEHTISTPHIEMKIRDAHNNPVNPPTTSDLQAKGLVSRALALRLSADLKDPLLGFRFGRNRQRCDFVIGNAEGAKRISNVHFRIYINEHGVVMLEDQSTNGTLVERVMLHSKNKETGGQYRHTLQNGSLINIVMTPPDEDITFVVRIPQREGEHAAAYYRNLQEYFNRISACAQKREAQRVAAAGGDGDTGAAHQGPPDIFAPTTGRAGSPQNVKISKQVKTWHGGPKYNRGGVIGRGAFATVYMITAKFDGTCFAAKELEKRRFIKNGIVDQKVDMEMKIMRKIKHPHIVQYIEHIDWDNYLYVIMEYVPCGDLGAHIHTYGHLQEDSVQVMASQVLSALKYLHKMGITHRDIKPDNILIQTHNPLHVKLTDFGLSKMVEEDDTFMRTFCGTLLYCAPEVYTEYPEYDQGGNRVRRGKDRKSLPQRRYDHSVDLWSLAAVIFYALCGEPPYPAKKGTTHHEFLNSIMSKPLDIRPLQHAGVSEIGIHFVRSMLQVRPDLRPKIEELQSTSWLRGDGEAMSLDDDDEDEVDMIREADSDNIEEGTSQLSIHGKYDCLIDDGDDDDIENVHAFTTDEWKIPASPKTGGSLSSESFVFMRNPPGNARLFGEVNASALGSSGVIPQEHLNLPVSEPVSENGNNQSETEFNFSSTSMNMQPESQAASFTMERSNLTQAPAAALESSTQDQVVQSAPTENTFSAPSLLGAESMVGQLQMDSPSPRSGGPFIGPPAPEVQDSATASLRRPREETTEEESRPTVKRFRSSRETDIPISKKVFWDAKDESTWHYDYPDIMLSEYTELMNEAQAAGENFAPGEKTWDKYFGSYRQSKSPSVEPESKARAQSEPTIEQGRQAMMKRDDRKLEEVKDAQPSSTSHVLQSASTQVPLNDNGSQVVNPAPQPASGESSRNDAEFKPPKRILGKFVTTPDSVMQSITINVTEPFTSWGRANNTVVYLNGLEDRIPKHAFKLVLWKQGLLATDNQSLQEDMSFWISTKAAMGLVINGVQLNSHDPKKYRKSSKEWAELRHGDQIAVWTKANDRNVSVKFRFECYFGAGQAGRPQGIPPFSVLPIGQVSDEIDVFCLQKEEEWRVAKDKERAGRKAREAEEDRLEEAAKREEEKKR